MQTKYKKYISLMLWVFALILIGSVIGSSTKTGVNTWYKDLNRSPLSPPNYLFGIVWTILYAMIATSGFLIWQNQYFPRLRLIKILYAVQLILNFSWTPLFFSYQLVGTSLLCIILMSTLVACMIYLSYEKIRTVSILMIPYLLWLLLATYLNFYIWQNN
jgi:translocator protein